MAVRTTMGPEGSYPKKQCPHGYCLNHGPRWKVIKDEWVPDPTWILGRTTYITERHCGQPMLRKVRLVTRQCKECGRVERSRPKEYYTRRAVCSCCDYHRATDPEPAAQ